MLIKLLCKSNLFLFFLVATTTINIAIAGTTNKLSLRSPQPQPQPVEILALAQKAMTEGRLATAQRLLNLNPASHFTSLQEKERKILLAQLRWRQNQPGKVIQVLEEISNLKDLPDFYQVQFYIFLAQAFEKKDQILTAIMERFKLQPLLLDPQSQENNYRAIWQSLLKIPLANVQTMVDEEQADEVLQPWLTWLLVAFNNDNAPNNNHLMSDFQDWRGLYPNFPGTTILPRNMTFNDNKIQKIALLLPLQGKLAGPGNAIKEGVLMAAKNNNALDIQIYNTNQQDITKIYNQAVAEGADVIVGPLSKPEVAALVDIKHPIPTILLNDWPIDWDPNLFKFGLFPSIEAKQIASFSLQKGQRRALIIAPEGNWAEEIIHAFTEDWYPGEGVIVDNLRFSAQENLNLKIKNILHVQDKMKEVANKESGSALTTAKSSAVSRRRQDIDMIFLIAYPSQASQIMPLLKYYYAEDVPVYALSIVYAGDVNRQRDRDLDGIIFCDRLWMFNHELKKTSWPEHLNSYNRLYALGVESIAVAQHLNQLQRFPSLKIQDVDSFYMNAERQISTLPIWAQFVGGEVKPLNYPTLLNGKLS